MLFRVPPADCRHQAMNEKGFLESHLRLGNFQPDARSRLPVTVQKALFLARFKTNTTAHWIGKLEEQDLLCSPVRTLAEALADEQTTINGMIMEAPGVVETVKVVGSPIHMSDAPVTIRIPPATLGQHTQDVLAELDQARPTAAE